jgi:Protein O-mannosyl-transferase TMEM260-like
MCLDPVIPNRRIPRLQYNCNPVNTCSIRNSCLLFAVLFGILQCTVCPSVYWLDSGEFLAAVSCLGLPHSPSFPVYVLFTHPFLYLPLGDMAFRTNVSGALWGALLAVIVLKIIRLILNPGNSKTKHTLCLIIAGAAVLNPLVWYQCIKAEVYTLSLFFNLTALYIGLLTLHPGCRYLIRKWCLIVVFFGLGFGTHMLLTAHIVPALGIAGLFSLKRVLRANIAMLVLTGLIVSSVYLYLPIRSAQDPELDLGNPEHSMTFFNSVTRRGSYERFFGNQLEELTGNIPVYFRLMNRNFTMGFWCLVVPGIVILMRKRPGITGILLSAGVTNIAITLLNRNFNVNPDTGPAYLMLSTLIWIMMGGILVDRLIHPHKSEYLYQFSRAAVRPFLLGLSGILLGYWIWFAMHTISLSKDFSAFTIGHSALENCEQNAVIFTGFYSNIRFVLSYLQTGEKLRTDITLIDRGEVTYWPGGLEKLLADYPDTINDMHSPAVRDAIRYLAPRGVRHSDMIPHLLAKNVILNYLARLALNLQKTKPVYWLPSEDDILLKGNYSAEGIFLRIADRHTTFRTGSFNNRIWSRYRDRTHLGTTNFRKTYGANVLLELLSNSGSAMETAGYSETAAQIFDQALVIDPANDFLKRKRQAIESAL